MGRAPSPAAGPLAGPLFGAAAPQGFFNGADSSLVRNLRSLTVAVRWGAAPETYGIVVSATRYFWLYHFSSTRRPIPGVSGTV